MDHGWIFPSPKNRIFLPISRNLRIPHVERGGDIPSGTFMLIAEDPLSGATNRQMISIPLHHQVNSEFLNKSENEQVFTLTSVAIGVFHLVVLAVMVRQ